MKVRRNISPFSLIIPTMIGVILGCCFSCEQSSNGQTQISNSAEIDSVTIWIEKARNRDQDKKERIRLLDKAFDYVKATRDDTTKLKYLSRIQWTYLSLGDSLQFRYSNSKTRTLASELNDSLRLGNSLWDLGVFFDNNNVKDSAFYHLSKAQKIFSEFGNNVNAGKTLYVMAQLQSQIRDYTGSEINTIKAIELLKPLNENAYLYYCYNLLGVISKDLGEYEKALENYNTAIDYLKRIKGSKSSQLQMQNNIGNVYKEKGDFKTAISYFENILNSEVIENNPRIYATALNNLAYSRYKSGSHKLVEKQLKESLEIRNAQEDFAGSAGSSLNLAKYYLTLGDSTNAYNYALQSKSNASASSNNGRLLEALDLLTNVDKKNANSYAQQYIALNDSLQQAERQIRNKFARIQFETEEVQAQNALLARQRQLWIGIAVGVLLLAAAIFIIISQRVRNQKLKFQQQQQEANNEIFSLMLSQKQKIEEGKQSEQKRISEELHDGVLGEMNGARMVLVGLNKKNDEEAVAMRSKAIAKLQEVQEEIRTISHELSDAAYQKFHNFIISIQELLQSVGNTASLHHTFTYDEEIDWDDLTAEIKINLYRIIQECLMNCVKHAEATNIALDLGVQENTILAKLKDDGKGFNPKKGKKGIGHKNISSRVAKIGGKWKVNSQPGEGTEIAIWVPILNSDAGQGTEEKSLNSKVTA